MSDVEWRKTLSEWRDRSWSPEGSRPYDLWKREPLRDFFRQNGYVLWLSEHELGISSGSLELIPPNDEPRRPDGFTFVTRYQCQPGIVIAKANFGQGKKIHCTARTIHNQDVVIRLISIDGDATGDEHYEAIRRLSAGPTAFRGDNHVLPLLNVLEFNGLRFVVFPLLSIGGTWLPWYYNADEILISPLIVVAFCTILIKHQDLDGDNILFNFQGHRTQPDGTFDLYLVGPFRFHFPVRYYISDFEMTVCFDKDSDPATRKITGLPNVRVGRTGQYDREYAPEMLIDEPYYPFKADVWYLGRMLNIDMDTNIKGFVEKAICEDFSFDEVFGNYFAQDTIQTEEIMQVFDEVPPVHGKFNEATTHCYRVAGYAEYTSQVEGSFPKEALKLVLSLLAMIAQMWLSNPTLRPDMAQLLDTVLALRKSSSHEVLSDYIGIQQREVEWEKW